METPEEADLILYNTCSIRDKAEQKVFHRLQQFKKEHGKGKMFGVLGCVAQQEGERIFERAPHVSLVAGSASYTKLPQMLVQLEAGNRRVTGLSLDTEEAFETPFTRRDNPHRAYITIIEGCDKSCAYCVVPFTRGPERSRTSAERPERSARAGAHGLHRNPAAGTERQQLSRSVAGRLGLRASAARGGRSGRHPARALHHLASARFRQGHRRRHRRESGALQSRASSGAVRVSDRVLERMQRLYTRDEYMRRIEWMKNARRNIAITTDIIVGFPGETEADFEQTLALLDEVEYDSLFSFKYSRRPNTSALALDDHIPEEEKSRRLTILQEKQRAIQIRRNSRAGGNRRGGLRGGI